MCVLFFLFLLAVVRMSFYAETSATVLINKSVVLANLGPFAQWLAYARTQRKHAASVARPRWMMGAGEPRRKPGVVCFLVVTVGMRCHLEMIV